MTTPIYSYDEKIRPIKRIDFDILSNEEIKNRSALGKESAGIDVPELYDNSEPKKGGLIDPRLGTTSNDVDCATCEYSTTYCPGHFGHIDLAEAVLNIGFRQQIKKILDVICLKCSKLLIDKNDEEIRDILLTTQPKNRLNKISELTKNVKYCSKKNYGCGTMVSKVKLEIKKATGIINIVSETDIESLKDESLLLDGKKKLREILSPEVIYEKLRNIDDDDCVMLGMDSTRSRPESMIHKVFPVPPVPMRPSTKGDFLGGSTLEDDLTHKLADIVKSNLRIIKQKESTNENFSKYDKGQANLLQYHVASYFDNELINNPKNEQKGKPFKALAPRLKSKEGRIRGRQNCF